MANKDRLVNKRSASQAVVALMIGCPPSLKSALWYARIVVVRWWWVHGPIVLYAETPPAPKKIKQRIRIKEIYTLALLKSSTKDIIRLCTTPYSSWSHFVLTIPLVAHFLSLIIFA